MAGIDNDILKETFLQAAEKYAGNTHLILPLWAQLATAYSAPQRHYHTFHHLAQVLHQLLTVKNEIEDWEVVLFSLFYHDAVYDAARTDNEEQSAALAASHLSAIHFPADRINRCLAHILATREHHTSMDKDTNLFTDADLSILGRDWSTYVTYTKQIRQEYAHYAEEPYRRGRKAVLLHFLQMPRLYKTELFFVRYEKTAKENLQKEWQLLM